MTSITIGLETLLMLVQHRWNISVLAALHTSSGAKFVTLEKRLGVSRSSLTKTLKYLTRQHLIQRNPGYGHPMRPEYILTTRGRAVGVHCEILTGMFHGRDEFLIAFRKWSLPLIAVIGEDSVRFNAVRAALGDPTPRALTLALKALEQQRWLSRTVIGSYPPGTGYELTPRGLEIWAAVRDLCRH